MALRALDAGAQEDARGVGGVIQRHASVTHGVADGGILPHVATGGDQLAHDLIIGLVCAQAVLDELRILLAADAGGTAVAVTKPEEIGPPVEEVQGVPLAGEQRVNEPRAFVWRSIFQKAPRLRQRGDAPDDVEVKAAHEDLVAGWWIGGDFVRLPVSGEELVERGGGLPWIGGSGLGMHSVCRCHQNRGSDEGDVQFHQQNKGGAVSGRLVFET